MLTQQPNTVLHATPTVKPVKMEQKIIVNLVTLDFISNPMELLAKISVPQVILMETLKSVQHVQPLAKPVTKQTE